jgi:pimeloyl-ACP methyl ester carboxylesterase
MRTPKALITLGVVVVAASALLSAQQTFPPDNFFDSNGVRIRYVDRGQGAPVVLIHGYTGNLERHWIAPGVFANLAKDHRVIALDCRGHGKSGTPTDPAAYGTEMGRDVVRLLDHLKIFRAHFVGFSMGAIILGPTEADAQQAEAAARELEGDTPFRSLVLGISPPNAPAPSDDEIRKLTQGLVAANDLKALAAYQRGRRPLVVAESQLAAVRVPALEIIGSLDPNLEGMKELRKILPALETVVVDGATHGGEQGVLRRPDFLAALRAFIDARR